jgi:hypothetical protein
MRHYLRRKDTLNQRHRSGFYSEQFLRAAIPEGAIKHNHRSWMFCKMGRISTTRTKQSVKDWWRSLRTRTARSLPSMLYGLRVPFSCVLYVPQRRRAACPLGASLYCTHAVRVPASGVPYVPRTVAPQVAVLPKCLARMLHAVHGQGRVRAPPVRLVRPRLQLLQRQLQCQPLGRSQRVPQQHWAHLGQRRRAARGR